MTAFVEGHAELADWFFLIAAVAAGISAILALTARTSPAGPHGELVAAALCLTALGLLVL